MIQALTAAVGAAADAGGDLAVLPECPLVGRLYPAAAAAAETIPGTYTDLLSALARQHNIHIVSGLEERAGTQRRSSSGRIDIDRSTPGCEPAAPTCWRSQQ